MIIYKCDVCGKEYQEENDLEKICTGMKRFAYGLRAIDVCFECYPKVHDKLVLFDMSMRESVKELWENEIKEMVRYFEIGRETK